MTVIGNVVFVLWIIFNAIDSGFKGTGPEKLSLTGLILLLALNSYLILKKTN
jgi:hypothetical protein